MRLGGRRSSNIEDRRGMGVPVVAGGGIGAVVIALIVMFLGGDPNEVLQTGAPGGPPQQGVPLEPGADPQADFVSQVLAETEVSWDELFRAQLNRQYEPPVLVLFTDAVQSECGIGQSAAGPFYCPLDRKVYLDLSFFRELDERFGAPGDFARAYVVAHEVGHHVQTLLGISQDVHARRSRATEREANALSVRQELQADCFAGVWARQSHQMRQVLEAGDVEEGLGAAAAIGDDRLQRKSQGVVIPETFTHGSSAQRVEWFRRGLDSGDLRNCDTFS